MLLENTYTRTLVPTVHRTTPLCCSYLINNITNTTMCLHYCYYIESTIHVWMYILIYYKFHILLFKSSVFLIGCLQYSPCCSPRYTQGRIHLFAHTLPCNLGIVPCLGICSTACCRRYGACCKFCRALLPVRWCASSASSRPRASTESRSTCVWRWWVVCA